MRTPDARAEAAGYSGEGAEVPYAFPSLTRFWQCEFGMLELDSAMMAATLKIMNPKRKR